MRNMKTILPPPERKSSIELLRIISMLMIVFCHFAIHGKFIWENSLLPISRLWYNVIVTGGTIGVNLFVLISGYFLVTSSCSVSKNTKKMLKIWGQLLFYSIVIYTIAILIGRTIRDSTSVIKIIAVFFPITFASWWFASTYFVLFLLHPFLNKFIYCLSKKSYQNLLVLLIICWYIIPTFTGQWYQGTPLLRFVTLYLIAGYLRIYGFRHKLTHKHYFVFCGIIFVLTQLLNIVLIKFGEPWNTISLWEPYSLFALLVSLTFFIAFTDLKIRYHKWINVVASATFGVYLIHDSDYVRSFLWLEVFQNNQYQNSLVLIPYSIAVVAVVYIMCTLIDLLRQQLVEKIYMRFIDRYMDVLLQIIRKKYHLVKQFIFET